MKIYQFAEPFPLQSKSLQRAGLDAEMRSGIRNRPPSGTIRPTAAEFVTARP